MKYPVFERVRVMNSNYVLSYDYMNVFGVKKSPAMIWCILGQTLPDPLTRVSDQL